MEESKGVDKNPITKIETLYSNRKAHFYNLLIFNNNNCIEGR